MSPAPERRRELLELLLARGLDGPGEQRAAAGTAVELSRDQRRLWFLEQLYPGTAQNNVALELDIAADPPARENLDRALAELQSLHEVLRFQFSTAGDEPRQQPVPTTEVPLTWHDLRDMAAEQAAAEADAIAARTARDPLDLSSPPLYRAVVTVLPGPRWRLVLVFHHIVVDGWSVGILLADLATLLAGNQVAAPSTNFAQWVAAQGDDEAPPQVRRYWRQRFADHPPATTLAAKEVVSIDRERRGGLIPFEIDQDVTRSVTELAQRLGVTSFAVCLAAFKVLLRRMGGAEAVVVGAPAAGRDDPRLDRVVGFFVRTLAVRTDIAAGAPFTEVVRGVHRAVIDALDNQPMPFDDLVTLTARHESAGANPIFRSMLAWQDGSPEGFAWAGTRWQPRDLDTGTAHFDLTFTMTETPRSLHGGVEWSASGADRTTAGGALRAFRSILRAVVDHPELRVRDVPLEPHRDSAPPVVRGKVTKASLADGFVRQAAATPNAVAVIDEREGTLTYAALATRVARTAACIRDLGLSPGDRVALLVERSVDMVVGAHAITAAGCAYVPIDTEAPAARIQDLLTSADVRLVVTHPPTRQLVPDGPWTTLDARSACRDRASNGKLATTPAPASGAAYLLHTSGSTGQPKPVVFPTDASQAFLDWIQAEIPIGPGGRVLLKTPYGFDVSVWELFWPLQRGATIVVARPRGHLDPRYLARVIKRHQVNVINFVPSLLEVFLDEPATASCASLNWILSAGEELSTALRDRVHARFAATLVNLYGPTECGAVTAQFLDRTRPSPIIPIGRPQPYTEVRILDENMRAVPPGLAGELYVGGRLGVATGYWKKPALTAERFVPDPFTAGQRLYRTGDLCRQLDDGTFQYLGRMDRQVKLHGVRIEPAEIETVLARYPAVAAARVLTLSHADRRELVAFYTVAGGQPLDADDLRLHAAARLPRQLVPATFVPLDRFPVNTNGKVDAAALTAAWRRHGDRNRAATSAGHSRDRADDQVRAAFEEVLGCPVPDPDTSFFELGGNSLLLLRLATALERRTGRRPGIAELAQHPTVRLLTMMLRGRSARGDLIVPLAPVPDAPRLVLAHPAAGSALAYLPLSQALTPDLAVYGLDAPGLGGAGSGIAAAGTDTTTGTGTGTEAASRPPRTVDGFVTALLPSVESLADGSPLVLSGWSFGGVLAYELSVALARRGKAPLATIILDAWIPAAPPERDSRETAMAFLRGRGLLPDDLPDRDYAAIGDVLEATMTAFSAYRPNRGILNPVYLFRAADGYPGEQVAGYTATRGWDAVVTDLHVRDIPGDHFDLLHPDNAPALAEEIQQSVSPYLSEIRPTPQGDSR